jgi:hypothetical protein
MHEFVIEGKKMELSSCNLVSEFAISVGVTEEGIWAMPRDIPCWWLSA